MLSKFKIPKIKFSHALLWQGMLLAFFVLFVVIFVLNVYLFLRVSQGLSGQVDDIQFKPSVLKKDLLETAVSEFKKKEIVFKGSLLVKPDIEDPAGSEIEKEIESE